MVGEEVETILDRPLQANSRKLFEIGLTQTHTMADSQAVHEDFLRNPVFRLRGLLEPSFAARVLALAAQADFLPIEGTRTEGEVPQRVGRILDVAICRSILLRWLEEATGCGPLAGFRGRLTQTREHTGGQREWHDDLDESDKRRLALVINLSPAPFQGGYFELRRKSGELLYRHHYEEPGEAILFRVDPGLEHRVLPVLSGGPRRVYAGWFVSA